MELTEGPIVFLEIPYGRAPISARLCYATWGQYMRFNSKTAPRSGRPFLFSIALAVHLLSFAAFNAQAQSGEYDEIDPGDSGFAAGMPPYVEYRKRIESAQNIAPLDNGLFGESVSLYNGSTDFTVADIDLPGNNGLPVQLSRRFSVELQPQTGDPVYDSLLRGVGNWDIDVPYLAATYPQETGWYVNRCSSSSVPPLTVGGFSRTDVWQGITVHVPGAGDKSMLGINESVPRPSDGVQYLKTTAERDVFDCIAMQSGLTGEGFRMTTASGLRYYFDIGTVRTAATLAKTEMIYDYYNDRMVERHVILDRSRFYLLASKIEDRFGNTVQFQYNSSGHPTRIWSSDGREVLLSYLNGRLATATSHGRTWQYQYNQAGALIAVTLPDASQWLYVYSDDLRPWSDGLSLGTMPYCLQNPLGIDTSLTLTATHPGGAVGTFVFSNRRHFRSGVHANECMKTSGDFYQTPEDDSQYTLMTPHFFDVMSLSSKSISGPGLTSAMTWTYDYSALFQTLWGTYSEQGFYPCTTCTTEKPVIVTNPDGSKTRYRYGVLYMVNDGRLLGTETLDANGTVVRTETNDYLTEVDAPQQAFYGEYGYVLGGVADPSTVRIRPVVTRTITQQNRRFKWQVSAECGTNGTTLCFDEMARPTKVIKTSEAAQ